ncbi:MAG: hypothetical protein HS111_20870 [Kofleriaceae bacterium]|nr:hypothetical protein [Kofleriaceae bacterium]
MKKALPIVNPILAYNLLFVEEATDRDKTTKEKALNMVCAAGEMAANAASGGAG